MTRLLLIFFLLVQLLSAPARAESPEESQTTNDTAVPYYDPEGEAVRSVLLPGWSQYRQGHDNAGLAYALVAGVTFVFAIGLFEFPLLSNDKDNFGQVLAGVMYGLNAVVSGFDAHRRADESNREYGWEIEEQALRSPPGLRFALVRVRF